MKKENPELFSLRCHTLKAIEKLLSTYKANSYKQAVTIVWKRCRMRHVNPGFDIQDFHKFYQNIRKFKSNFHKNSQVEKKYLFDMK